MFNVYVKPYGYGQTYLVLSSPVLLTPSQLTPFLFPHWSRETGTPKFALPITGFGVKVTEVFFY